MPDIDSLVGDLGKELAHDRHRQRRRGEVAELTGVLGVHLARGQPCRELVEDGLRRHPTDGSWLRSAAGSEEGGADPTVVGRLSHGSLGGVVVEEVQGGRPGRGAKTLERLP